MAAAHRRSSAVAAPPRSEAAVVVARRFAAVAAHRHSAAVVVAVLHSTGAEAEGLAAVEAAGGPQVAVVADTAADRMYVVIVSPD